MRISDWSSDVCSSDLVDEYRDEFAALLERAIGHAGGRAGRVLVLSIPDWGVTPFAAREGRDGAQVAREIDAFNAAARDTCGERGVAFVDITAASRGGGGDAGMVADDGLHPSAAMYSRWTQLALPAARGSSEETTSELQSPLRNSCSA